MSKLFHFLCKIYADPDGAKGREEGTVRLETGTIRGTSSVDRPPFASSARAITRRAYFWGVILLLHDPQLSIISLCARCPAVSARHGRSGGSYSIKNAT